MKIVLIRHGKTAGNLEKRYIGRTDEILCQNGIDELKKNISSGKILSADLIFVSPMKRCIQTAEILYGKQKFLEVPEFCEMDFGDFEGKNYNELKDNLHYQEWINSNGTLPFPSGESREQFVERVMKGYSNALSVIHNSLNDIQTVVFVVHGGTIMAIMSSLGFGSYFDFQLPNGGSIVFDTEEKSWHII